MKTYTIIAFAQNEPGVLYRIANLFLRRKITIDSLTVSETETHGISRFTIVVTSDKVTIEKIVKQLYRIIEMHKVFENEDSGLIFKELAFYKVSVKSPVQREEIEKLAKTFRASISFVGADYLIVEKSGTEDDISSLFSLLRSHGIREFVRSGRIAMVKEPAGRENVHAPVLRQPSHITTQIEVSAIKRIQIISDKTPGTISLAQGKPSLPTPQHVRDTAKRAIDEGKSDAYTIGYGIPELREVIAKKVTRDNGIPSTADNVIVTHGAIEALMATFIALFDPDDEIVIITPDYASHITQFQVATNGSRPIFVPLRFDESGRAWHLDTGRLESAISPKTKAILFTNPSNPTGHVFTEKELRAIADCAKRHNLFVITDEIYEYFVYDGKKHTSIGSFEDIRDRVVSVFGVSKSYCMTGWRIGYLVAHEKLAREIFKVHDNLVTCPAAVSQYAALAAISGPKKPVEEFRREYGRLRNIVVKELSNARRIHFAFPEGAYYAFAKVDGVSDDIAYALELIRHAHVAVVPGSAFGRGGEGFFRISFCYGEKQVREGLKRFINYVENHSPKV